MEDRHGVQLSANIYMTHLEESYVYVSHHFSHVPGWWRYIDDIFLVWVGTVGDLMAFHTYLNTIDEGVKFTLVYSNEWIQLLDTKVSVYDGSLITDLSVKETNKNTMLRCDSHHPRPMVRSLPYSQMLRVKKIVQDPELLPLRLEEMGGKFITRKYSKSLFSECHQRINAVSRERILQGSTCSATGNSHILFVSDGSESVQIAPIVRWHWGILRNSFSEIEEFQVPPLCSYRRNKNLSDKLVRSDFGSKRTQGNLYVSSQVGCCPCFNCIYCSLLAHGNSFMNPNTGQLIHIKQYLTCDSTYVVDLLECPCGLYYVGETTWDLRTWINQYRYSIRKKQLNLPVSKHFTEAKHVERDLRFRILQRVQMPRRSGDRTILLKRRMLFWIYTLQTLKPRGLHVEFRVV